MKKIVCAPGGRAAAILLLLALLAALLPCGARAADAVAAGYCGGEGDGKNLTWLLDAQGTLTIGGRGSMAAWSGSDRPPWNASRGSVKNVVLEEGVTSVGENAFSDCSSMKTVSLPDGVTELGDRAFCRCGSLESVIVPGGVTRIGSGVFYACRRLTEIDLPACVTEIGEQAFFDCPKLTNVSLPHGVTAVGDSAFEKCTGLSNMTFPATLRRIGDRAFLGCRALEAVTILEGLAELGDFAFQDCAALRILTLPESLRAIGAGAFSGCASLTALTLPAGLTDLGEGAFRGLPTLRSIRVEAGSTALLSEDGVLFDRGRTTLLAYPAGRPQTEFTVPQSVTRIGAYAFSGCAGLTAVTLPSGVTEIGSNAFQGCAALSRAVYRGCEAQWETVHVAEGNESLSAALLVQPPEPEDISGHWAEEAIRYCLEKGLISGLSDTRFAPDAPMTRAMFVTALGRLSGIDAGSFAGDLPFEDVAADAWYAPYLRWALSAGVIKGISDTEFAPDASLTREQLATLILRWCSASGFLLGGTAQAAAFTDAARISPYAREAVEEMRRSGLVNGFPNGDGTLRFEPQSSLTRAQCASILQRMEGALLPPVRENAAE